MGSACETDPMNGSGDPEPVFPADYRTAYTEVRDCRFSIEHGGVSIRVLANDVGAQAYLNGENPLPVGSVILKEEYNGSSCSDDSALRLISVMRKESPGFDVDDGDWHWQEVTPQREVINDFKTNCIGCHDDAECLSRDYMCTEE